MRVILSAMGRTFLRDGAVAFLALGVGIWAAPNLDQALALAGAASIAALAAGFRGIRIYVPHLSEGIAKAFGLPSAYGEVAMTAAQTALAGFLATALAVLAAPDLNTARAAGLAGILAVGTALTRTIQAWLTPGESPGESLGIGVPPQPVPAAALPTPASP